MIRQFTGKFLVNKLDDASSTFNDIRSTVEKLASRQSYWNEYVPAKWIELEKGLDIEREKKKEQNKSI